jgi:hypothetical protein
MQKAVFILAIILFICPYGVSRGSDNGVPPDPANLHPVWASGLPVYDHVVIVMDENKDYAEIIGNPRAPYINHVLKAEGAVLTKMYAEEHFSEGDYFWLFSGDNQTVGFTDRIPSEKNNPHYPFATPNLGEELIAKGFSFKGYAEGLPEIGFTGETAGLYARKHVPWISFANVPDGNHAATSSNLRFRDFPSDPSHYADLPTVAFVIPNLQNDMHNGPVCESIPTGDRWLRKHMDTYYQWAKKHNSLLILIFDENHDRRGYQGLTNPLVRPGSCADREYGADLQNRIPTIFAGAHVRPGDYPEGSGVTHVNILRTLEAMYGLNRAGAQQPNAAGGGISDNYLITDLFQHAP